MKYLLTCLAIIAGLFACRKNETASAPVDYLSHVRSHLQQYPLLDADLAIATPRIIKRFDTNDSLLCQLSFPSNDGLHGCLLLSTDLQGNVGYGRIVSLEFDSLLNGTVEVSSLDHESVYESRMQNGFISVLRPQPGVKPLVVPGSNYLPEVIVVAQANNAGGVSMSTWMSLLSMMNQTFQAPEDYGSSLYIPVDGGGGPGGGGGGYFEPLEMEVPYTETLPGLDVRKLFNCFDNVPSAGATYSITLNTDIPSNHYPSAMVNLFGGGIGHVFLTVTKKNGSASVTQSFGFFAADPLSYFNGFPPVRSQIVNNGSREVNASLTMNLTAEQFGVVRDLAYQYSIPSYNLQIYNCVDYALNIVNAVRSTPIAVDPVIIDLPAVTMMPPIDLFINRSPQTLFQRLQQMKNSGHPEAAAIVIDQTHSTHSAPTHGECN